MAKSYRPTWRTVRSALPPSPVIVQKPCQIRHSAETIMTKALVLYYSSYGHIETMAEAVAEDA